MSRPDPGSIVISITSPEQIYNMSYGEITKSDTFNYRTGKAEPLGLFCPRIFGPQENYECACGKYKRMKYRGIVCEKCGVEVTLSKVRRERMGHIKLASPVAHTWFVRSAPSKIGTLLDIAPRDLDKILYMEGHIVIDPGMAPLNYGQLLTDEELARAQDAYGADSFISGIGASAIKEMLCKIDLEQESKILRSELVDASETKRRKIVKRLKLIINFLKSGNKPEWMILDVLPVMPADLRPLVPLEGGRYATTKLNDLYRRVINRNNRLARLMELGAAEIILRNEKRMLQEAVDSLFGGAKPQKQASGAFKQPPTKSLADLLKGKQGRFRQNLLGKRVDYSGRSVIVVGPELKLHQCGLPKQMAIELFKPFVYNALERKNPGMTFKYAKKMVESERPEVWDALEEVIKERPVLLNRAPTLHRLGIQAFEPVLVEGKAIQLHPLVCAAFNADFDGDQMAVHVPISIEACVEARVLMMSTNNILSPQNGKPIVVPSQDMILGLYIITLELEGQKGEGGYFADIATIEHAIHADKLSLQAKIKCRRKKIMHDGSVQHIMFDTTPGRVILSELLPENANLGFDIVNKLMTKKEVAKLMELVYRECGQKNTVIFADKIMQLGFKYACFSGISIGKDDMLIPPTKEKLLAETYEKVHQYENQHADGLITRKERGNKILDAWYSCVEQIGNDMIDLIATFDKTRVKDQDSPGHRGVNSMYMMTNSGARGSITQTRQICGMRGLMVRSNNEIIEVPIVSNFKEGLAAWEYFVSTNGARKGLADTALRTADSGYLTRKLVDVSQDCIIQEVDCDTGDGLTVTALIENGNVVIELYEKILGRTSAVDALNPTTGQVVVKRGDIITEDVAEKIDEAGIDSVKIRSVITCETKGGVCTKCYGRDLATGSLVNIGEAVGVIAAQSIGEPGTQLTMRTFHIGGVATKGATQSNIVSTIEGKVVLSHKNVVTDSLGSRVVMSKTCEILLLDDKDIERARYKVQYGSNLLVEEGAIVTKGQKLAEWDPFTIPIITGKTGFVSFIDLIPGVSVKEVTDETTGAVNRVVVDWRQQARGADLRPRIVLNDENGYPIALANDQDAKYMLPADAILNVSDGQKVQIGDVLAKIPREASRTRDITGGLPRVVELFEARKPKNLSIIADEDGYISFGKDYKSKRRIILKPIDPAHETVEYFVPRGKHIVVNEGDFVAKGDMLMDGTPSPHDILRVMGVQALAHYIINEVQQVYRLQGVKIDDKHIEIVLRQMLRKVEVVDPGETTLLTGQQVDSEEFEEENTRTIEQGYMPAVAIPVLLGLTKASLNTNSFLSAASFQETPRVLTEAAVAGKVDRLRGLKEATIVGSLIPAGTGFYVKQLKKEAYIRDKIATDEESDESNKDADAAA